MSFEPGSWGRLPRSLPHRLPALLFVPPTECPAQSPAHTEAGSGMCESAHGPTVGSSMHHCECVPAGPQRTSALAHVPEIRVQAHWAAQWKQYDDTQSHPQVNGVQGAWSPAEGSSIGGVRL